MGESYLSVEVQSVYSTTPADWARMTTLFRGTKDMLLKDFLTRDQSVNAVKFFKILYRLKEAIRQKKTTGLMVKAPSCSKVIPAPNNVN